MARGGLSLNGSTQYLTYAAALTLLGSQPASGAAWVYCRASAAIAGGEVLFHAVGTGGTGRAFSCGINSASGPGGGYGSIWTLCSATASYSRIRGFTTGNGAFVGQGRSLGNQGWHHLAWTRDGGNNSTFQFYVDGVAVNSGGTGDVTSGSGTTIDATGNLLVGALSGGTQLLNAIIREFGVWTNRKLSAAEVLELFETSTPQTLTTGTTGLSFYASFDTSTTAEIGGAPSASAGSPAIVSCQALDVAIDIGATRAEWAGLCQAQDSAYHVKDSGGAAITAEAQIGSSGVNTWGDISGAAGDLTAPAAGNRPGYYPAGLYAPQVCFGVLPNGALTPDDNASAAQLAKTSSFGFSLANDQFTRIIAGFSRLPCGTGSADFLGGSVRPHDQVLAFVAHTTTPARGHRWSVEGRVRRTAGLDYFDAGQMLHQDGANLTAWANTTAYTADVSTVSAHGQAYDCITSHTSAATDEPGVGANWTDQWRRRGNQITASMLSSPCIMGLRATSATDLLGDMNNVQKSGTRESATAEAGSALYLGSAPRGASTGGGTYHSHQWFGNMFGHWYWNRALSDAAYARMRNGLATRYQITIAPVGGLLIEGSSTAAWYYAKNNITPELLIQKLKGWAWFNGARGGDGCIAGDNNAIQRNLASQRDNTQIEALLTAQFDINSMNPGIRFSAYFKIGGNNFGGGSSAWAAATAYSAGNVRKNGTPSKQYICLLSTAGIDDAVSEPGVGTAWTTYWQLYTDYIAGQLNTHISTFKTRLTSSAPQLTRVVLGGFQTNSGAGIGQAGQNAMRKEFMAKLVSFVGNGNVHAVERIDLDPVLWSDTADLENYAGEAVYADAVQHFGNLAIRELVKKKLERALFPSSGSFRSRQFRGRSLVR